MHFFKAGDRWFVTIAIGAALFVGIIWIALPNKGIAPGMQHILSPSRLAELRERAMAGDGQAASRIGLHMYFSGLHGCAEVWYRRALANGQKITEESIRAANPQIATAENAECGK